MGAYLPAVFEEVLDLVDAVILTEKVCALWMRVRGPRAGRARGGGDGVGNTSAEEKQCCWGH